MQIGEGHAFRHHFHHYNNKFVLLCYESLTIILLLIIAQCLLYTTSAMYVRNLHYGTFDNSVGVLIKIYKVFDINFIMQ